QRQQPVSPCLPRCGRLRLLPPSRAAAARGRAADPRRRRARARRRRRVRSPLLLRAATADALVSENNGQRKLESPQGAEGARGDGYVLRLGGMALRNGLLIHGPTSWAAAARDDAGEIQLASGRKPALAPELAAKVPLLRGPLRLAEAFLLIPTVR